MEAAQSWGMAPSEFYSLGKQDQAYMVAKVTVDSMIKAWEVQVAEEDAARAARRRSMSSSGRRFRSR